MREWRSTVLYTVLLAFLARLATILDCLMCSIDAREPGVMSLFICVIYFT
jgi:hypothetical protein